METTARNVITEWYNFTNSWLSEPVREYLHVATSVSLQADNWSGIYNHTEKFQTELWKHWQLKTDRLAQYI